LYTTIDILRPAQIAFPSDVTNILIVNNSIPQPHSLDHIDMQGDKANFVNVNTDSLAIFCIAALYEDLLQNGFFNHVDLELNTINTGADFYQIPSVGQKDVAGLLTKYDADLLITLDRIRVRDKITDEFDEFDQLYISTLEAVYETNWSICDNSGNRHRNLSFTDTLYWDGYGHSVKNARAKLPDRENALIDGALYAGQQTVNRFTPYWEKEDRYFFNPSNKRMKEAMDAVRSRKWERAIEIWKKILEPDENERLQAFAANNIAIGYEILGDIDKAIDYATVSFDRFAAVQDVENAMTLQYYLTLLHQRKNEFELLDRQLGN
jgi:tetratricopeptide (TPR) repeat protein